MAQTSRTFRIFVSSTFSDLVAERNALQERVFPRLRDLCQRHGSRFQAIDLRWGVSQEASLDQQAMSICLGEIERCQRVTPRPNFIVLLGDRYGWCPPPPQIPDDEFTRILGVIGKEDQALLQRWYRLDRNAVPPEWRLNPRERGSSYEDYDVWRPVESRLHTILAAAAVKLGLTGDRLLPYTASATEQEIAAGALRVDDAAEHVHCFFRTIEGLPEKFSLATRDYLDLDEREQAVDHEARRSQNSLKDRLAAHVPLNVHTYRAQWTGDGISTGHIDPLCEDVFASLSRIILAEIEHPHEIAPEEVAVPMQPHEVLDDEGRAHHRSAEERLRFFVGRKEMLAYIAGYLGGGGNRALAIVGAGGIGKSALMAKAVEEAQAAHPNAQIVFRFVGSTPGSSDGRGLLESLCREISRRYGADESDIPLDYRDLVPELGRRMALASADKPLILFLDSLDQLSASQGVRGLAWLPVELPAHVSVVVSTRPEEDIARALQAKQAREALLSGLSSQEGEALMAQWLESVHRTLQDAQRREVLEGFKQSGGNPLYLKLAFEEARLWASFQPQEKLAVGVAGIIQENMIGRLRHEGNHGAMLVSHALGYLAASRYGLAEDELVDLLSRDLEVYAWFFQRSYHLPYDLVRRAIEYRRGPAGRDARGECEPGRDEEAAALAWLNALKRLEWDCAPPEPVVGFLKVVLPTADGPRLPVVLWSRLSFDLAPYLAERLVDGSSLLSFYHRELADVSRSAFLIGDSAAVYHGKLADYFRSRADPAADRSWTGGHIHALSELPYQLAHAHRWDELQSTLTDFSFLQAKVGAAGPLPLVEDYDVALAAGYGGRDLALVRSALVLSTHILARDGGQLAGQLVGRLMTQPAPAIQRLVDQVRRRRDVPWLRPLTPSLLQPGGPMIRTLDLQGDRPSRVLMTAGCTRAVSGAQVWDLASGEILHMLEGRAVAVSADGRRVVSSSDDTTLTVWDLERGQLLYTLVGSTPVAVTPDGTRAISGADGHTLKVWDLESGQELCTLEGHTSELVSVEVTSDGRRAVSCCRYTLRVWDLERKKEMHALEPQRESLLALAVTPDGTRAISGGGSRAGPTSVGTYWPGSPGSLEAWDLEAGERLHTLEHWAYPAVEAVAIAADGSRAVSCSEKAIKVWDLESGELLHTLEGRTPMAVTPDGRRAVSGSEHNTLKVWKLDSGEDVLTLEGHSAPVCSVALSPDGTRAVSNSFDKTLKLWDLESRDEVSKGGATAAGHTSWVAGVAVVPDGTRAVSCSHDMTLKVWDLDTVDHACEAPRTLKGRVSFLEVVAVTPDGTRAVSGGYKILRVWDLGSGEETRTLEGHTDHVNVVAVTPDGRRAVSGSNDKTLRVWDLESGEEIRALEGHRGKVATVVVTPDGSRAVSGDWDNTLKVWDLASGDVLHTLAHHGKALVSARIAGLVVTADGTRAVSCLSSGPVKVWDLESGRELHSVEGGSPVAVTPDGTRAVSRLAPNTLKVWDLDSGAEIHTLEGHSGEVVVVAVTGDGTCAVSGSLDKTLRVWDLERGEEMARFEVEGAITDCAVVPHTLTFIVGEQGGKVHFLRLENVAPGLPCPGREMSSAPGAAGQPE